MLTLLSFTHLSADKDIEQLYSCFAAKDIKVTAGYDKIQWGLNDPFMKVCLLSFEVTSEGIHREYTTRRWRSPAYCKKFTSDWKDIKRKNQKVCIAGYLSNPEKQKDKKNLEQIGYWEVIKSEEWCHTYFMGNCKGIPNSTDSF